MYIMEDAEFFLPSEIARLVYGQMKTLNCHDVSEKFLETSPHLSECRELRKTNRTFKTEANGLPLKDILDQYLTMNKLILNAANAVSNSKKFTNPIEGFKYILKLDDLDTNDDDHLNDNSDIERHSDYSNDEISSDISLNVYPTPDKRIRKKIHKKLESIMEDSVDPSHKLETEGNLKTLTTDSIQTIASRKSARIQNKRASCMDKSSHSDSIKELRKNQMDTAVETPCKVGKPPYSETKIRKPKATINLQSESDQDSEFLAMQHISTLPIDDYFFSKDFASKHPKINSLFSSPESKKSPPLRKTIKTLKPRRPPNTDNQIPEKIVCKKEGIKCKRNSALFGSIKNDKKTKLDSTKDKEESSTRVELVDGSKESLPNTDIVDVEKPKNRRKSTNIIENDEDKSLFKQNKLNKSSSMIDNETPVDFLVLTEKLMDHTKLHERLAANINKVISNSPQKITGTGTEELDNAIQKVIRETETDPLFDEILQNLIGDTYGFTNEEKDENEKKSCNFTSQVENCEKNSNFTNDQVQSGTNFNVLNPEIMSNIPGSSIIIDMTEQGTNEIFEEPKNLEKSVLIAEDIRRYVSCTADISSSPDRENLDSRNQESINFTENEINLSYGVQGNGTIYIDPTSSLYPISESLPVVISKQSAVQIYTKASLDLKHRFIPIAPKPEIKILVQNGDQKGILPKKRRCRGRKND